MNVREYLCLSLQESVFVFVQNVLSKHLSFLSANLSCSVLLPAGVHTKIHEYTGKKRSVEFYKYFTHTHTHTCTVRQKSLSSEM